MNFNEEHSSGTWGVLFGIYGIFEFHIVWEAEWELITRCTV